MGIDRDEDLQYLKGLRQEWWKSRETVQTVAVILNKFGSFRDTGQVIDYSEKILPIPCMLPLIHLTLPPFFTFSL
ncbi:hypothetical protein ES703_90277 [subsurface metagenome]